MFSYIAKYIKLPVIAMFIFIHASDALAITNALKLKISNAAYSDETVVRYLAGATCNFDGSYDAWKIFSSNKLVPSIYTQLAPASCLSINAHPDLIRDEQIQIYARVGSIGTYTITATEIGAFANCMDIFIENKETGSFQNLRTNPVFTISVSDTGVFNASKDKFIVYFSLPVVFSPFVNPADNKSACALSKTGVTGWTYTVKDNAGDVVASNSISKDVDTLFNLSPGTYYFTSNYGTETTKVQTFNIGNITGTGESYPKGDYKLFLHDNVLTIDFNNIVQHHIMLSIFTLEGQLVTNATLLGVSKLTVPVNETQSGIFIVKLQADGVNIIEKLPVALSQR